MEDPAAESVVLSVALAVWLLSTRTLWTKKLNRTTRQHGTHQVAGLLPSHMYKYCLLCRHLLLHRSLISTK